MSCVKRLRSPWLALLLLTLVPRPPAFAQSRTSPIGVGWQVGDPSGATAKLWLDGHNALQGTLGWRTSIRGPVYLRGSYYYEPSFSYPYLSIDWVHQSRKLVSRSRTVYVAAYVGVGGGAGELPAGTYYDAFGRTYYVDGTASAEVRVPLGAVLVLTRAHFELYAEVVPTMRLVPEPFPNILGGVGGRYYF